MQETELILVALKIAIIVLSVVAHEVAHGYMALALGDQTARRAGRLTLNPASHFDPIGSFLVPLATILIPGGLVFGWAKPVPYNPYNLRDQRYGDAKVALAGPMTNVALALAFGLVIRFFGAALPTPAVEIMALIVFLNLGLAVFNLIPIPPLDGSKVFLTFLPHRYRYLYGYLDRYFLFFAIIIVIFLFPVLFPLVAGLFNLFTGASI